MFRILIPTDFSPTANTAALYAIEIARQFKDVELNFFHCIETSEVSNSMVHKVEDILLKQAETELKSFVENYAENIKPGIHFQYDIVLGMVSDEILSKIKNNHTDLVVMGTTGAGGLKRLFMGSNAANVVENIKDCPVIVVPENTKPKGIKKITYATDLEGLKSEAPMVIAFARLFDAKLDIIHITQDEEELKRIDPTKKAYELVIENNYAAISFNQEVNLDVLEGIEQYAINTKANIVAMFARRKSYFDSLFKSYTKEMAFHAHMPLLIIPYDLLLK
jgi:nucleotide-binding universal stress UspA family protein